MAIFCQNMIEKCQFWAKNSILWAGVVNSRPLTLFCRCSTKKNIRCTVWDHENRCFKASLPKKKAYFLPKMA